MITAKEAKRQRRERLERNQKTLEDSRAHLEAMLLTDPGFEYEIGRDLLVINDQLEAVEYDLKWMERDGQTQKETCTKTHRLCDA